VNKKILILNKDIDELSSIRQMFAKEGCEVITASNWETALKLISKIEIDLLVLDANSIDLKAVFQKSIPIARR
jgi:DNA-binding response OmpR family regulator